MGRGRGAEVQGGRLGGRSAPASVAAGKGTGNGLGRLGRGRLGMREIRAGAQQCGAARVSMGRPAPADGARLGAVLAVASGLADVAVRETPGTGPASRMGPCARYGVGVRGRGGAQQVVTAAMMRLDPGEISATSRADAAMAEQSLGGLTRRVAARAC